MQSHVANAVDGETPSCVSVSIHSRAEDVIVPTVVKDITFWGGFCLLICNTTGPGSVSLPQIALSAGWIPTLIGFILIGFLSYLSSLFICEAMTEYPGNDHFQANVEFSNLVHCFFGRRYKISIQLISFIAMQTTNIASIAICAQLFDNLLIQIFRRTCGIQLYPTAALVCVTEQLPTASPFSGVFIMSTGALVALVLIVPLCLMNLSENIWLQIGSCILILLIFIQWIVTFFQHGLEPSRVPAVGSDPSQMFGLILFNFAFVTAIPSLANAKKANVSIHKTAGASVSTTTVLFILVSILGGMAFEIPDDSTLIQAINSAPNATTLSLITGYTFPIVALVTSIPVNTIVLRYNLIQSELCNKMGANVLACLLPWLVAIPCMTGSGLSTAVQWSSLLFVSAANFVIPFILYIFSQRFKKRREDLDANDKEQQVDPSRELTDITKEEEEQETITSYPRSPGRRIQTPKSYCLDPTSPGNPEKTASVKNDDNEHSPNQEQVPRLKEPETTTTTNDYKVETLPAREHRDNNTLQSWHSVLQARQGGTSRSSYILTYERQDNGTLVQRDSSLIVSQDESSSPDPEVLAPPFLSGHNYSIPVFGACQRSIYSDDNSGENVVAMEPQDGSPHDRKLSMRKMQAIPDWIPISGMTVAVSALALLLTGICATIVFKIVQP
ncbi:hypothetical protein BGX31_007521 [Mortierella sp. GBA43]|nr:hypothetical protein BGX31_007521 [Mortierella sp. GBA43]